MSNTGSDHVYREKVAGQYVKSAQFKSKLKTTICVTGITYLLVIFHLGIAMEFINISSMSGFSFQNWEYMYLGTSLFSILGYLSIQSSKISFLTMFSYGTTLLTIPSQLWGFYIHFPICVQLYRVSKQNFLKCALECSVSAIIFISMLLHALALYYSNVLLKAWNRRGHKVN